VDKIIMDGIERHRRHAEIEDDQISDLFEIESEPATEVSFSQKMASSERTAMNFQVFISVNFHTVALSSRNREHEHFV
jgi:hypothetical protein